MKIVLIVLTIVAFFATTFVSFKVGISISDFSGQINLKSIHFSYCKALDEIKKETNLEKKNEMIDVFVDEIYQSSWDRNDYMAAIAQGLDKIESIKQEPKTDQSEPVR